MRRSRTGGCGSKAETQPVGRVFLARHQRVSPIEETHSVLPPPRPLGTPPPAGGEHVFLPQGVDAGSVGRDGRGWVDGASGSGGGGVGAVDIGLFRWV